MTSTEEQVDLAFLEKIALGIDPNEETDSDLFRASVVVLACLCKRVNLQAISDLTGYEPEFIGELLDNLVENDQVEDDVLAVDWVTDEGIDQMGFSATVLCAAGLITVTRDHDCPQKASAGSIFQNPEDPSLTWKGRGRRPAWLTELINEGVMLEELAAHQ